MNPSLGGSGATSLLLTVLIVTIPTSTCRPLCTINRNHQPMGSHNAEGVWCLDSGACETGVEPESPWMGSRCLLN